MPAKRPIIPFYGQILEVTWLEYPNGTKPAEKEYRKSRISNKAVEGCFGAMDLNLQSGVPIPKTRMETFVQDGLTICELKAPQKSTSRPLGRLLCYRPGGWRLEVAVAGAKKEQDLRDQWINTAVQRIKVAYAL